MSRLRNGPSSSKERGLAIPTSTLSPTTRSPSSKTIGETVNQHTSSLTHTPAGTPNTRLGAQCGNSAENDDGDEEDDESDDTAGDQYAIASSSVQSAVKTDIDGDASMVDTEHWVGLQNEKDTTSGEQEAPSVETRLPGRSRASSASSASSGVAASEFDVPDDDDDYAALENLSNASDDLHVEREESIFIRDALETDNAWDVELSNEEAIDWTDEITYQASPSGLYDDILVSYGMQDSPLHHFNSAPATVESSRLLPAFGEHEIDPHLSHDLFRTSSLTSESSSAATSEGLTLTPDETFPNSPDIVLGDSNDSDTEVEDMTEELAQRAEMLGQRRKAERRRKKSKKRKPRSKSLDSEQGALVLKKFPAHPKRSLAYTVSTPRGSILRFTMPKNGNTSFRWVTGRTRPNPLELSPMTPAYASAMQGRLFQLYHCPNTPNLAPRRSKTMSGDFGRSSSFSNLGPYSVQRSFTASGGLSEAFFVDLDDATDDGDSYGIMDLLDLDRDESISGEDTASTPTPLNGRAHSLPGRIRELDDDEADFKATALSSPSRCRSPVAEDLPSSAMVSPSAAKRRYSDTSDTMGESEGPIPKRQSLHGTQVVLA